MTIKKQNELAIYQAPNRATELNIDNSDEMIWLNLDEIAFLFEIDTSNVSRHLKKIFSEKIEKNSTVAKNATVHRQEGKGLLLR